VPPPQAWIENYSTVPSYVLDPYCDEEDENKDEEGEKVEKEEKDEKDEEESETTAKVEEGERYDTKRELEKYEENFQPPPKRRKLELQETRIGVSGITTEAPGEFGNILLDQQAPLYGPLSFSIEKERTLLVPKDNGNNAPCVFTGE
jgi:hypothetical protein